MVCKTNIPYQIINKNFVVFVHAVIILLNGVVPTIYQRFSLVIKESIQIMYVKHTKSLCLHQHTLNILWKKVQPQAVLSISYYLIISSLCTDNMNAFNTFLGICELNSLFPVMCLMKSIIIVT